METWTIIILGATGDLSRSRLLPTLYEIIKHRDDLSFAFIGSAKDQIDIVDLIQESITGDKELIAKLCKRSSYIQVDFTKPETFKELAEHIDTTERKHTLSGNRLVYFAIASQWYCTVTKLLTQYGIVSKNGTHRVVYEKPFGWDAQSAQEINACITKELTEEQIYRVDHYLTKSLVTSLLLTRFSNVFFEPIWNNTYIDQVQILLNETEMLDKRGDFYDKYGALKDVVQNHMLQLLSFIAMEKPPSFDPETISEYKNHVLKHTTITDGLLGQYDSYKQVPGVDPNSHTETYALLKAKVDIPHFKNIPIYIKTDKALDTKSTEIHIVFKPQAQELMQKTGTFDANRLIIRISPDSAILLRLNAQKARAPEVLPISMEFCYRCTFGQEQPHSYETLFYEIMRGDKSATVTLEEIVYAWNIIAQIQNLSLPLHSYTPGSSGPPEAQEFTKKYGINWDTGATVAKPSKDESSG